MAHYKLMKVGPIHFYWLKNIHLPGGNKKGKKEVRKKHFKTYFLYCPGNGAEKGLGEDLT